MIKVLGVFFVFFICLFVYFLFVYYHTLQFLAGLELSTMLFCLSKSPSR